MAAADDTTERRKRDFWSRRLDPLSKMTLLIFLVCCFALQCLLVYCDYKPTQPLSDRAIAGRRIWHEHNCQACHQTYGFGGFLGPDLTNAAEHLSQERLEQVLTNGAGPMPAFHLNTEQISLIHAYLQELDKTGRGQARQLAGGRDAAQIFTEVVGAHLDEKVHPEAAKGFGWVAERGCLACHVPFAKRSIGPDHSTVVNRLSDDDILKTMTNGRPPGMPPTGLTADQQREVLAYFHWFADAREEIRAEFTSKSTGTLNIAELPWWEYR